MANEFKDKEFRPEDCSQGSSCTLAVSTKIPTEPDGKPIKVHARHTQKDGKHHLTITLD